MADALGFAILSVAPSLLRETEKLKQLWTDPAPPYRGNTAMRKQPRPGDDIPLTDVNIGALITCYDALAPVLQEPIFLGQLIGGQLFLDLIGAIRETLKDRVRHVHLVSTLSYLQGHYLTEESARQLARWLAGNRRQLAHGPITPWTGQLRQAEWHLFRVLTCDFVRRSSGEVPVFDMQAWAGTCCPAKTKISWDHYVCKARAPLFGFSREPDRCSRVVPRYPYSCPEQLVGLFVYGLVEPERLDGTPVFRYSRVPAKARKWNLSLLRKRFRVDEGYTCPRYYPRTHACHRCLVGYDECPAATHPRTFVPRLCGTCKQQAPFDPGLHRQQCVNCQRTPR